MPLKTYVCREQKTFPIRPYKDKTDEFGHREIVDRGVTVSFNKDAQTGLPTYRTTDEDTQKAIEGFSRFGGAWKGRFEPGQIWLVTEKAEPVPEPELETAGVSKKKK